MQLVDLRVQLVPLGRSGDGPADDVDTDRDTEADADAGELPRLALLMAPVASSVLTSGPTVDASISAVSSPTGGADSSADIETTPTSLSGSTLSPALSEVETPDRPAASTRVSSGLTISGTTFAMPPRTALGMYSASAFFARFRALKT